MNGRAVVASRGPCGRAGKGGGDGQAREGSDTATFRLLACEVNPPLKGAGLFSGKLYTGQDLVANKPFIDALNMVIEVSITKCLDKIGTAHFLLPGNKKE